MHHRGKLAQGKQEFWNKLEYERAGAPVVESLLVGGDINGHRGRGTLVMTSNNNGNSFISLSSIYKNRKIAKHTK